MKTDTKNNTNAANITEKRRLLWDQLETYSVDNPEYTKLCGTLLEPIISDLEIINYKGNLSREFLLKTLAQYDEYGPYQEFVLSRLWQKLPYSLSGTILKSLISDELNQLIAINNQLILNQYNFR